MKIAGWVAVAALSAVVPLGAGQQAAAPVHTPVAAVQDTEMAAQKDAAQKSPKPAFEVASIHEWGPGQGPSGAFAAGLQFSTGRVRSQCVNLEGLLFQAYQLTGSKPQGLPQWGRASCGYPDSRDTFAIEATMPPDTTMAQTREMIQALLAERFKLLVHWETRQLPVYALRVTGKTKLKPSDPDKDPPTGSIGCPADDTRCHMGSYGSETMTGLTGLLSQTLERPVIDKTGLTGSYYFGVLKWAGEDSSNSPLPSLFALMREQFGLELKPELGPVPVLVIDHVEKPTAN